MLISVRRDRQPVSEAQTRLTGLLGTYRRLSLRSGSDGQSVPPWNGQSNMPKSHSVHWPCQSEEHPKDRLLLLIIQSGAHYRNRQAGHQCLFVSYSETSSSYSRGHPEMGRTKKQSICPRRRINSSVGDLGRKDVCEAVSAP